MPASESASIILSVAAGKWFKPRMLWVKNNNTIMNEINFYIGGSATDADATLGGMWIGPRETTFIALDGITINTDLWVSCLLASCEVRIAGILLESAY